MSQIFTISSSKRKSKENVPSRQDRNENHQVVNFLFITPTHFCIHYHRFPFSLCSIFHLDFLVDI